MGVPLSDRRYLGMFGDDRDALVMTARIEFGEVSDEQARGLSTEQRD